MAEESLGLGLRFRCRDHRHSETEHVLEVLVRSLREDGVLFNTNGDIAHIINGFSREAAKVARAREGDMDELIEEIIHPSAAQRDLEADRVALAHFEGRD